MTALICDILSSMQGILLCGGEGTRCLPLTKATNKHLLGVNGKFIIDYPINTLKNIGCDNITIVLGGAHYPQVIGYLGDGSRYGLNFNFILQERALGIAHAINLCKRFVYNDNNFSVCLGDNWFENPVQWNQNTLRAQITLTDHKNINSFGVASIDKYNKIVKIEEKPKILDNNLINKVISGCYLFTPDFFHYFKESVPSSRGEFEITEIINRYLKDEMLSYNIIDGLWSDLGSHESIAYINNYLYNK